MLPPRDETVNACWSSLDESSSFVFDCCGHAPPPNSMPPNETGEVSRLLDAWRGGEDSALERLMPLVYDELHALAHRQLRGEREGHTLQTTALLHEAYLRLMGTDVPWEGRVHFFAVAARAMRRVLVDHARGLGREKRGGGAAAVTLDENLSSGAPGADLLDLDEALERLAALDDRKARAIELHYFGGLEYSEIGQALGISEATVHRDLRMARAWLQRELVDTEPA
jgi:RNA polymerase sigma factor (TIGR02999 family)